MVTFEVDTNSQSQVARLVRFATGKINPQVKDSIQMKCYSSVGKDSSDTQTMAVTAQCNGMNYVGKNYGSSSHFLTDSCDYYVGIRSRKSDKIRVMPAQLFLLHPQLIEDTDNTDSLLTSQPIPATSRENQNRDLTKSFGSGKIQRKLLQKERMKLEGEMISSTSEHLAKSSAKLSTDSTPESPAVVESSIVPAHNKKAEKPEDVFKLKDLISPEVLAALVDQSQVLYDSKRRDIVGWRTEKTYFGLVLCGLEALPGDGPARLLQCQCLTYLQCLMTTYNLKTNEMRKRAPLPSDWSEPVKSYILDHFTFMTTVKPFRRLFPPRLRDLLLSHIIVFSLKLNQFFADLELLALDLKMPIKRLMIHATAIGCKVKKHASSTFATVCVPYAPKEIVVRRTKRRSL